MRLITVDKQTRRYRINYFFDWLLHMIGYSLILIAMSILFKKTIKIDNSIFGFWALLAAIIISFLNKTIKPLLVWLTLPLTGITLGLFYPFINVLILYMVSWILASHFIINGIFMTFIVAVIISIMNIFMDFIINDILRKR